MTVRRRDFLAVGLGALPVSGASSIRPPGFPSRDFPITTYGAIPNSTMDSLSAVRKAITECHAAGGGRVVVPAGDFLLNGPIHLQSRVNLHLAEGSHIRFSPHPGDYLPAVLVRWEGTRCFNYSPLIYAYRQEGIAITGPGTLDGQAQHFLSDWRLLQSTDQTALRRMGKEKVEVTSRMFGDGHFLRPQFVEFYDCRNILVEDIVLQNSPFWNLHLAFCTNVTVRRIHVQPGTTNDDGVDVDSCKNVLIEDSKFETFDDCVVIKAGRDQDAWGDRPCEDIAVRRCTATQTRGYGFCIGSEMSGSVRNVSVEDCHVEQTTAAAVGIKANTDRGGTVENILFRRISIARCGAAIRVATDFQGVVDHPYPPLYRNLHFSGITCDSATQTGIHIVGLPQKQIHRVELDSIEIKKAATPLRIENADDIRMHAVRINGMLERL